MDTRIDPKDFTDYIKKTRKKLHITQEEISKAIGVSTTSISLWERGRKLKYENAIKLLDALQQRNNPPEGAAVAHESEV